MAQKVGPSGLLISGDDDEALGQIGGATQQNPGQGVFSPLQNVSPQLAGGAAGVERMNYGQALANAGRQFPFNAKFAAMDQALQRAIANAGFDRTNSINSINTAFTNNTTEAKRQSDLAQKALQQRMASQGLGFSGINVEATGDLTQDYNRYINAINSQYKGGIAGIENAYGRTLGDISAQREGLYAQQAEEERVERERIAREQAEAARQERLAQQQAQLVQQQIAAQQAALQRALAQQQSYAMPRANSIGAGGGGGPDLGAWGFGGGDSTQDQINQLKLLTMDQLTSLYAVGGIPEDLKTLTRKEIVQRSTPGSPNYYQTPVGHRDRPYGFDQGGVAL